MFIRASFVVLLALGGITFAAGSQDQPATTAPDADARQPAKARSEADTEKNAAEWFGLLKLDDAAKWSARGRKSSPLISRPSETAQ